MEGPQDRNRGKAGDKAAQKLQKRRVQLNSATEVNTGYYDYHTHPAYNMFGWPDFVDVLGRQYRVAFKWEGDSTGPVMRLLRYRAESVATVDATMDDLIRREATAFSAPRSMTCVQAGDTRVRLWVRVPKRKAAPISWIEPGAHVEITYRGDEELGEPGDTVVEDVHIVASQRSDRGRATGYVDVTGLCPWAANKLLERRLAKLTDSF